MSAVAGPPPGSNFEYSAALSEMVLLGVVAMRTGRRIEWDAEAGRITKEPALNKHIEITTRVEWKVGPSTVCVSDLKFAFWSLLVFGSRSEAALYAKGPKRRIIDPAAKLRMLGRARPVEPEIFRSGDWHAAARPDGRVVALDDHEGRCG